MAKPLTSIRVLDLTNVLAGPYCCHQLAHMGAEVIKVEKPGSGDLARRLGSDENLNNKLMGISFLAQNAGKKSITLNLKSHIGRSIFLKLVKSADVIVENFRPGVMKRLKLDYQEIKKINKNIILCSISGFGQTGPWRDNPAYDQIIQGLSGLMSLTGDCKTTPMRVGFPVADTIGGMTAAFAIASALNSKPRGIFIDISMLEALLSSMGWAISNYLNTGIEPLAHGNENPTSAPSGTFTTSDGLLNIAANKDEHWVLLTDHLGLSHLRKNSNFATREARKNNRFSLRISLETILSKFPAEKWARELNEIGVPAGKVLKLPDIMKSEQIQNTRFLIEYKNVPGVNRNVRVVTTGIKLDEEHPIVNKPPPKIGEQNIEVYSDLGLSKIEIDMLQKEGVI